MGSKAEQRRETFQKANCVVENHIADMAEEALGRMQMEMHGEGCGCRNCVWAAVAAVNGVLELLTRGNRELMEYYGFDTELRNGKLVVVRSESWERNGKY